MKFVRAFMMKSLIYYNLFICLSSRHKSRYAVWVTNKWYPAVYA